MLKQINIPFVLYYSIYQPRSSLRILVTSLDGALPLSALID